jgi:superfamily II DNA or RNA helicase
LKLLVKNSRSKLEDCPTLLEGYILEKLSYIDPDSGFPVSLYDPDSGVLPTGLIPEIIKIAGSNAEKLEIVDMRPKPEERVQIEHSPSKSLRLEYQEPDLDIMLQSVRGVVKWPTGAGKTLLATYYIARRQILPVIFYVHRVALLEQTHRVFSQEFNPNDVGRVGGGFVEADRPIVVATIQTVGRALKILNSSKEDKTPLTSADKAMIGHMCKEASSLIVDECHHQPASTLMSILNESGKAYHRLGLSATPFRADGLDIMITAALGPRIVDRTASELSRLGFLVNAHIRFVVVPGVRDDGGLYKQHWSTIYRECILKNEKRNDIIVEETQELYLEGRITVIFVNLIKHGRLLAAKLRERLPSQEVIFVEGETDSKQRESIFNRVKEGTVRVLLVTPLGDEGLDLPSVDAIVLADAGRSPVEKIQQIGRGLRPFPGKKDCKVIDFWDRSPMFKSQSASRWKLYDEIEEDWTVGWKTNPPVEEKEESRGAGW